MPQMGSSMQKEILQSLQNTFSLMAMSLEYLKSQKILRRCISMRMISIGTVLEGVKDLMTMAIVSE